MKIAVLQSTAVGFFPRFYYKLIETADRLGDEIMLFSPNGGTNNRTPMPRRQLWGTRWNWHVHFHLYQLTGIQDVFSNLSTLDLIRRLHNYKPDVIHMHTMNEFNLSFPLLVHYLNHLDVPVIWTFHDCRTLTARCPNFEIINCQRWKTGCKHCPKDGWYRPSLIDNTKLVWKIRRHYFNAINNLMIVTPSEWLAGLVKQSYLNDKSIKVIYNGIDVSDFSKVTSLTISKLQGVALPIVLGVANIWDEKKGSDTMAWLAERLKGKIQIVLVGHMEQSVVDMMPSNVICIAHTKNKDELVALYQQARMLVNPTLADNFPTVNIESLGAGTPVVTYDTGGSAECLEEGCGIKVKKGDRNGLLDAILEIINHPDVYTKEKCIKRSSAFSLKQFDRYFDLYHQLVNKCSYDLN